MRILYLAPDVFGAHGGIARHSRVAIKALTESPSVECVDVLALMDPPGTQLDSRYFGVHGRWYIGCGGDRRRYVARLVGVLASSRYDAIVCGHVNLAPLMFMAAPLRHRTARITVLHGIDVWRRLSWLRRLALHRSHVLVAVSQFTAQIAMQANDLPVASIAVVHNCLDPFFEQNADAPVPQRANALLTVARLLRAESSKGHDTVLRALPSVARAIPDVRYDVVGDGDLRPDLERLAVSLHIDGHVRFHGALPDHAVRESYQSCAAYVMPSKWEGFGLVFLEAMAHGRPIIASTRDAAAEVLDDTALLVEPDDPVALAHAICTLLQNNDLRAKLGRAAHARLCDRFTYDRFKTDLVARVAGAVGTAAA